MTPAELVDRSLQNEQIAITSLQNGTLSYFDSQRRLQQTNVRDYVQLRDIGGRESTLSSDDAVVELTDGQRFVGQWVGASHEGASLRWQHPTVGVIALPLDRLHSVRLRAVDGEGEQALTSGPPPLQDEVTLVNNDVLRGFVVELTEAAVVLMPDGGDETWTLPRERIVQLRLANPEERPEPGRQMLALSDGSRLAVSNLTIVRERVHYESPLRESSEPGALSLDQLAGVGFTAHGRRLVSLADQPMHVSAGGEVFGLPTPPRTIGRSIHLQAPVTIRFDLPDTAERFTAVAELATGEDTPPHLLDWADFELIVRHGHAGEHETRYRLHGSQPRVQINLPIQDAMLRLELEPGVNGPILDRLRLRDAMLLLHKPVDPISSTPETGL